MKISLIIHPEDLPCFLTAVHATGADVQIFVIPSRVEGESSLGESRSPDGLNLYVVPAPIEEPTAALLESVIPEVGADGLINPREAGEILGVTASMVYVLRDQGKLPFQRVGRLSLFDPADVHRFAEIYRPSSGPIMKGCHRSEATPGPVLTSGPIPIADVPAPDGVVTAEPETMSARANRLYHPERSNSPPRYLGRESLPLLARKYVNAALADFGGGATDYETRLEQVNSRDVDAFRDMLLELFGSAVGVTCKHRGAYLVVRATPLT